MPNLPLMITLSSAGLLISIYFSYHMIKGTVVKCFGFGQESCERIQSSKYSRMLFGIPNSVFGILAYFSLVILSITWSYGITPLFLVEVIVLFGLISSLILTGIQFFVLRAFCPWCLASAFSLALFTVSLFI